ncbi:MAG TPA: hypothetical protein VK012_03520, partial [Gemmatimonadales bacterium]|nr:hypothetical protein [Gemmatimonadales bacterium]
RSELFALQDSIAAEVSNFLRIRIGEQIERRASRAGTRNAQAWELLQHAREEAAGIDRIIATGDTGAIARQFARTDSIYAAAAAADPAWASPLTERGWLSYRLMRLAGSKTEAEELITQGQRHAAAALALSASDPDALELQATLTYWRWLLGLETNSDRAAQALADAERDYRAAVTANPQQASAWTSLSHLLINKAQVAEANLAASRAYEADPYLTNANVTLWRLFTTSLDLEDEIQARRWCEEGSRRFGSDPRFVECRLLLFALKGVQPDVSEAWRLLDEYVLLSPPELRPFRQLRGQMIVATALARAGLDDSARSVILRSRAPDAQFDPTRELAYLEAVARTILGDTDEAFSQLSLFLATNPAQRATFAADQTWWFRPLRTDRRYRSLTGGA